MKLGPEIRELICLALSAILFLEKDFTKTIASETGISSDVLYIH